ncbi:MAG: peptide chain release factor N(5)-glutamine methyltransferase [Deltaproteobacteria bacterium]|nr:peptide chain release factor N(5)-glutamine methyltransferase [Deltaproteobacteria bacterium]
MDAAALLAAAAPRLAAAGIDSARLDAELLLADALGLDRSRLFARLRDAVPEPAAQRFAALIERRRRREPLAYLTGGQEFWSLRFAVTPAVLIPRPETELLVELALALRPRPERILDVGTGSGCIAVALARELPAAQLTAVDLSPDALAVARQNAAAHGVIARIGFVHGDVYAALPADADFDLIVSNPPYLAPADAASPETACEPRAALFAGADGLDVVRRLLAGAVARLRPGGHIMIEIGQGQADAVLALASAAGLRDARVVPDLAGIPRTLVAAA